MKNEHDHEYISTRDINRILLASVYGLTGFMYIVYAWFGVEEKPITLAALGILSLSWLIDHISRRKSIFTRVSYAIVLGYIFSIVIYFAWYFMAISEPAFPMPNQALLLWCLGVLSICNVIMQIVLMIVDKDNKKSSSAKSMGYREKLIRLLSKHAVAGEQDKQDDQDIQDE